jgi:hypothetical protein
VADQGWSHVVVDGKILTTDRLTEDTTSVKGKIIDAWCSGKAHLAHSEEPVAASNRARAPSSLR